MSGISGEAFILWWPAIQGYEELSSQETKRERQWDRHDGDNCAGKKLVHPSVLAGILYKSTSWSLHDTVPNDSALQRGTVPPLHRQVLLSGCAK